MLLVPLDVQAVLMETIVPLVILKKNLKSKHSQDYVIVWMDTLEMTSTNLVKYAINTMGNASNNVLQLQSLMKKKRFVMTKPPYSLKIKLNLFMDSEWFYY